MSSNEVIEKLKKLILKEESCRKIGNLEEAGLYAAKVAAWCLRYKIELASINTNDTPDQPIDQEIVSPTEKVGSRTIWWQNEIAKHVCLYTGCCHAVFLHSSKLVLSGKEVDRQLASYLLRSLCTFIAAESQRQYDRMWYIVVEKQKRPSWELKDYRNSWIHGALDAIKERLTAMQQTVENDNPGACVALVLKKDIEAARAFLESKYKDTKKISSPSAHNLRAFNSGREAGQQVSLNRPLGTNAAAKALA